MVSPKKVAPSLACRVLFAISLLSENYHDVVILLKSCTRILEGSRGYTLLYFKVVSDTPNTSFTCSSLFDTLSLSHFLPSILQY